ncbi:hypothetical protein HNR43_000756 [Anoxybacillus mongoliensis]|uniref:Protein argonaute n=1 Tax=Anoxybacillus mongoliensis TaxID=452565 RepID=A0A7W8N8F4_9BACL|nr:Piwi domain-containing protein [Anoxybacillus mongoliensis]MBB5354797.1 hypothetical protein [Anoxybacillus mongoliensis]
MNQYYITECIANENASNIPLHIYTVSLLNPNQKYSFAHHIVYELRKRNPNVTIAAHGQYIASFQEITHWGDHEYIKHEYRAIECFNAAERTVLERLLKQELIERCKNDYKIYKDLFCLKTEQSIEMNEIIVYPAIYLSFTVEENGNILIGFEYQHRFEYKKTLEDLLRDRSPLIKEGVEVVDSYNKKSYYYTFVEVAPYTAGEKSPYLQQSVIDYYITKNEKWKLKGVHNKTPIVHVRSQTGDIFPYLPHLLRLTCSYEQLMPSTAKQVNRIIKLPPNEKMPKLYQEIFRLLQYQNMLTFRKENVRAANLNYDIFNLSSPLMEFGRDYKTTKVSDGLGQAGVYEPKSVTVSYFVDPELNYDQRKKDEILDFTKKLQDLSEKLGVKLNVSKKPRQLFGVLPVDFFKSERLSFELKSIADAFDGTVIVIGTEENIDRAYMAIKREFGAKADIMTQFVIFDSSVVKNLYYQYNVLLGIYAKSGVQPWILSDEMNSDCFIGLDVSHEHGKHASGIIQVIGKDGRMIKQKSVMTAEAGETIANRTMEEIIDESIFSYEKMYGMKPAHITFHRDGVCREDLDHLTRYMQSFQIPFDFVEIIKRPRRRMAVYTNGRWFTVQGLCYAKERMAYLCATDPRESVGMAQAVKIVQKTQCLSIRDIVSDAYKLSFMHIHSMLKTRLPITVHYADLSSTFHNRGLIHPRSVHEQALPFV